MFLLFTGELCPVVGLVSMDSMTIKVSDEPTSEETFTIMTEDYDPVTSPKGIASQIGCGFAEFFSKVPIRMPTVFVQKVRHLFST